MDSVMESFNTSIHFDQRLYKYDIAQNQAYAKALNKAKVLSGAEYSKVISALTAIEKEIDQNRNVLKKEFEDIHMNIETMLTKRVGEAGKKIHTGRSRNDQVATDVRMYVKDEIGFVQDLIKQLQKTLIFLADGNFDVIMPGYTHMQRAQPVLFAHHMLAYYEMFKRDAERLAQCYERADVLPLGSAALAGSSYHIDRQLLMRELGFSRLSKNSMDAVSDRDFVIEFLAACSLVMMHLSRMSEEIVLWATSEFKFVELSDTFSTGSSIMPQKKNPDAAELTRGKTGRVYGSLLSVLTMMKGLPLSYNRDMQEDKEQLFDAVDTVKACLSVMNGLLRTVKINGDRMMASTEKGCLTATDLADHMVKKGLPFRQAHEITGNIVKFCLDNNKDLYNISSKDFKKYCDKLGEDIHDHITIEYSLNSRDSVGGTSPVQVLKEIKAAKGELAA